MGPTTIDAPAWLENYLATRWGEAGIALKEEFLHTKLENDSAIVLLDGLDDPPPNRTESSTEASSRMRSALTVQVLGGPGPSL